MLGLLLTLSDREHVDGAMDFCIEHRRATARVGSHQPSPYVMHEYHVVIARDSIFPNHASLNVLDRHSTFYTFIIYSAYSYSMSRVLESSRGMGGRGASRGAKPRRGGAQANRGNSSQVQPTGNLSVSTPDIDAGVRPGYLPAKRISLTSS